MSVTYISPATNWCGISVEEQPLIRGAPSVLIQEKIVSISLAGFMIASQICMSWTSTITLNIFLTSITYLSETYLRKGRESNIRWLSTTKIHFKSTLTSIASTFFFSLLAGLTTNPSQVIAQQILTGDPWILFSVSVNAPICEEILFRGFLKERIEDISYLFGNHICDIPDHIQSIFSSITQAAIFGYLHITDNQVLETGSKLKVLIGTMISGIIFSSEGSRNSSLLPAIGLHAANNSGLCFGLLLK